MRSNSRRLLDDSLQIQSPPRPHPADDPAPSAVDAAPVRFDSSSMAVTALVLLSVLFFLGFFSVYARRFFAANYDDEQSRRRPRPGPLPPYRGRYGYPSSSSAPGLDPLLLRALPLLSYSGAGKEQAGCAVCLSEFGEKETVKAIPGCGHVFHPECIDAWLLCHGSCPLCRSTELFGLNLRAEAHVEEVRGEGTDSVEMARLRGGNVEVEVAVERGGPDQERRPVTGRSLDWEEATVGAV